MEGGQGRPGRRHRAALRCARPDRRAGHQCPVPLAFGPARPGPGAGPVRPGGPAAPARRQCPQAGRARSARRRTGPARAAVSRCAGRQRALVKGSSFARSAAPPPARKGFFEAPQASTEFSLGVKSRYGGLPGRFRRPRPGAADAAWQQRRQLFKLLVTVTRPSQPHSRDGARRPVTGTVTVTRTWTES